MNIALGSDHAGWEGDQPFKPALAKHLEARGHHVVDCGPYEPGAVDYPDFAQNVCDAILDGRAECGVLMCGTGVGVCIAANRNKGIRGAPCTSVEMAKLSREHNNANVLCLGRRILTLQACLDILDAWLDTPFSDAERHHRRVDKMG